MATQPIKNTANYEKFFSNEIKHLLSSDVIQIAQEFIPVTSIVPEIFFVAALSNTNCMLYKVLNGYLTSVKISEIYDSMFAYTQDKYAGTAVRPGRKIDYSPEMKALFQRANAERSDMGAEFITSDHLLLAILNDTSTSQEKLAELLAKETFTYSIAKPLSEKMHEANVSLAKIDNKEDLNLISDNFIGSVDPADGDDATVITISGTFPDDMNPADLAAHIQEVFERATGKRDGKAQPQKKNTANTANKAPQYSVCLNDLAEKGEIDPIIGREKEIDTIIKVFERRKCNNAILVGEPGVGKTAVVEGLARQIVDGNSPASIKNCKIFRLNAQDMMAGTQFRGMFEERLSTFIREINKIPNAILFIDNIHSIFNDRQKADYDFSSIFETLFNESKIKVIATITPKGYHAAFENDGELNRKFQKITIEKPSINECVEILNSNKQYYEQFHKVVYSEEAINACVNLAARYITDRNLPSSAMDVMDEAGADKKINLLEPESVRKKRNAIAIFKREKDEFIKKDDIKGATEAEMKINGLTKDIATTMDAYNDPRKEKDNTVTVEDVYHTVSEHTGIPIQKINVSERKFLSKIDKILKESIIGQDEAIDVVSRAIKRNKVGLSPSTRPIFSCICIGSTGTGKTLLAKKLAQEIFGDEKYLVRFDMSEYSDKTAVNKLIGASAGYVGYSEGGLLTEAIKNKKHAVLLIDEIEKANDEIFNLFLQILDEGCLTDNTGHKVDFRNVILIMTSNVGAKKASTEKGIGFIVDDNLNRKDIIEKELRNKFPPEFINRLDEIVYFNTLSDDNLKAIIRLEIGKLQKKLNELGHSLTYNDEVIDYIFKIISKQKEYGARPIIRAIQQEIENRITDLVIDNDYETHDFNAYCIKGQDGKKTLNIK